MPLDEFSPSYDHFYSRVRGTYISFSWLPRKCFITKKRIWLKNAYVQVAMYTGPGEPVFEYRWYDKNEFLLARVRGQV